MVPAVASAIIAAIGVAMATIITVTTVITAAVVGVATIVSRTHTNNDSWTIIPRINHRRGSSVNHNGRGDIGDRRGRINDRGRGSVNWRRHINRSR